MEDAGKISTEEENVEGKVEGTGAMASGITESYETNKNWQRKDNGDLSTKHLDYLSSKDQLPPILATKNSPNLDLTTSTDLSRLPQMTTFKLPSLKMKTTTTTTTSVTPSMNQQQPVINQLTTSASPSITAVKGSTIEKAQSKTVDSSRVTSSQEAQGGRTFKEIAELSGPGKVTVVTSQDVPKEASGKTARETAFLTAVGETTVVTSGKTAFVTSGGESAVEASRETAAVTSKETAVVTSGGESAFVVSRETRLIPSRTALTPYAETSLTPSPSPSLLKTSTPSPSSELAVEFDASGRGCRGSLGTLTRLLAPISPLPKFKDDLSSSSLHSSSSTSSTPSFSIPKLKKAPKLQTQVDSSPAVESGKQGPQMRAFDSQRWIQKESTKLDDEKGKNENKEKLTRGRHLPKLIINVSDDEQVDPNFTEKEAKYHEAGHDGASFGVQIDHEVRNDDCGIEMMNQTTAVPEDASADTNAGHHPTPILLVPPSIEVGSVSASLAASWSPLLSPILSPSVSRQGSVGSHLSGGSADQSDKSRLSQCDNHGINKCNGQDQNNDHRSFLHMRSSTPSPEAFAYGVAAAVAAVTTVEPASATLSRTGMASPMPLSASPMPFSEGCESISSTTKMSTTTTTTNKSSVMTKTLTGNCIVQPKPKVKYKLDDGFPVKSYGSGSFHVLKKESSLSLIWR